jgi:hypothetical protein
MATEMVEHGKCGKVFGANRSHCGGCCETFIALSHFEAHRTSGDPHEDGTPPWSCRNPDSLDYVKVGGIWGPVQSHINLVKTGQRLKAGREAKAAAGE